MSIVSRFQLHNFRSYAQARFENLAPGLVVLIGPNGAGKTNVLEAVSLLSPGRGLRGAKNIEMQCRSEGAAWAVSAHVQGRYGTVQIGTGLDAQNEKRIVRVDGESVRGQNALAEYLACVWLTPQMDRLFIDSAGHRRRFLDRLVFAFDPGHSGRIARYENAMAQRSRLLKDGRADAAWLAGLESQMAETGTAIAAARLDFTARLQSAIAKTDDTHFPRARLTLAGTLEELLQRVPALEAEDLFKYQLAEARSKDAVAGGASTGPHRSDLNVLYAAKNMGADQCSTGEQKALLIGIILAHARLVDSERGSPPLLLLDEVAAHLDENRRAALYDILQNLGGQVWLTGTEESLFAPVRETAQFYDIRGGTIHHLPAYRRALSA